MPKFITPRIEGGTPVRVAEEQPEYEAVDVIFARNHNYSVPVDKEHNAVIMAVTLSGEERQRIINGEDIYIVLLTFGYPQQPIAAFVGPEGAAEMCGLEVKQPNRDYMPLESGEIMDISSEPVGFVEG